MKKETLIRKINKIIKELEEEKRNTPCQKARKGKWDNLLKFKLIRDDIKKLE